MWQFWFCYLFAFSLSGRRWKCECPSQWFRSGKDLGKPSMQLVSQKACFPDLLVFFPNHVPLSASVKLLLLRHWKLSLLLCLDHNFFACITSLITWGGRCGVCFHLPEPQLRLCGVSRVKDMSFTEEHSAAWNGSWNGAGTRIFVQFWFSIKLLFPVVSISCLKWKWLFHTSLVRVVSWLWWSYRLLST